MSINALKHGEIAVLADPLCCNASSTGTWHGIIGLSCLARDTCNTSIVFDQIRRSPLDHHLGCALSMVITVSGKSGYARVLKKGLSLPRCTSCPLNLTLILPAPTTPATATITCNVGGVDKPIAWTDG